MQVDSNISVSIVLYNTPLNQLRACLDSLIQVNPLPNIYLIDNSPEDQLRRVDKIYNNIFYLHLPSNPGFGSAHNIAIRKAQRTSAQYHLVLNADVYFLGDILSPIKEFMDSHPRVGHIMPKVLNPDGSVQHLCKLVPSPVDLLARRFMPNGLMVRQTKKFEMNDFGYDKIMFVPYLSGCFMFLRHKALLDVGLFDERFFMYPEDIDLTRRIAQKYETLFFPSVSVFHEHGAASRKSIRFFLIHVINMVKYFNKWGWFHDPMRVQLNQKTLSQFNCN